MGSSFPSVHDVQVIERKGPWDTKSGGKLSVLFSFPLEQIQSGYFHYEDSEAKELPQDIRGLRSYLVSDIPTGRVGANEWHKIRNELVFSLDGSVKWACEDLYGNKKSFTLDSATGLWVPPYILHTYEAQTDGVGILVVANTLFDPNEPATHDTYPARDFYALQSSHPTARADT